MAVAQAGPVAVAVQTGTTARQCPAVGSRFRESRPSPTTCPFSRNSRIPAHLHPCPPSIPPFRLVGQNRPAPRPHRPQYTHFPAPRAAADRPQFHRRPLSPAATLANCPWIATASAASRNSASNRNLEKYGHHRWATAQHRSPMTAAHHAAREASANIRRPTPTTCCPAPRPRPSPAAAGLTVASQRDRE